MRKNYSFPQQQLTLMWNIEVKMFLPFLKVIFDSENVTSICIKWILIEKSHFFYFDLNQVETNRNGKFDWIYINLIEMLFD